MATVECINTCSLLKQTRPTWKRRSETLRHLTGVNYTVKMLLRHCPKPIMIIIIIIMCQQSPNNIFSVQNIIMKYLIIYLKTPQSQTNRLKSVRILMCKTGFYCIFKCYHFNDYFIVFYNKSNLFCVQAS